MIELLPLINMMILLVTALLIVFIPIKRFGVIKIIGSLAFSLVLIFSVVTLLHVQANGAISYIFGGYERFIGVELYIDVFASLFTFFIGLLGLLTFIYSIGYVHKEVEKTQYNRYYVLIFILFFAAYGIIYTNDLFNTYVFMEILSLTACGIVSIKRKRKNYMASFRYLILNEIGSLSFLFGTALLYMITGYTNITLVNDALQDVWHLYPVNIVVASGFMIVGVGIKAAIFPFHVWLPDAHSSAPIPSHAILSAVVLKLNLIVLVKVLYNVFGANVMTSLNIPLFTGVIAGTGMIMGSVFAIAQHDIKRILAYSSVAQVGYIVLGISLMTHLGQAASYFHVFSHGMMKSALFFSAGCIIYVSGVRDVRKYNGMFKLMPLPVITFSLAALGMIGIPLTSGFLSKYYLGMAALDANQGIFVLVIIISSILNAIYYLPIVIRSFLQEPSSELNEISDRSIPYTMMIPVSIFAILILVLGIYPGILTDIIDGAIMSVVGGWQ